MNSHKESSDENVKVPITKCYWKKPIKTKKQNALRFKTQQEKIELVNKILFSEKNKQRQKEKKIKVKIEKNKTWKALKINLKTNNTKNWKKSFYVVSWIVKSRNDITITYIL